MSTQEVLDRHLAAFGAGDLEAVMADYTGDSVMVTANGVAAGLDEIRAGFTRLFSGLFAPGTYEFILDATVVSGEIALITWHATCAAAEIPFGSDTFVIRDGVITAQTVALTLQPR